MNNRQVAEAFAEGRTHAEGSNFYVEGDTIYSYGSHFPIARWTGKNTAGGLPIILFTTRGYSNTTSKHKSHVSSALAGQPVRVIMIDDVTVVNNQTITDLINESEDLHGKAGRARSEEKREWLTAQAEGVRENAGILTRAFELI